ncbi:hypothetical protein FH972_020954 [Carpinus fangiana]|uniref:Hexosyltransferase n=1 Tax=Carpinus fangiana TaxID=176857 RepID=A0A5N6KNB4_9ROSI|nr:hypothetical protein FH972_020954 [Carpinus fangiana]
MTLPPEPNIDIPPSPPDSPPSNVSTKVKRFLQLKATGVHFNQRLASSSALKNPSLLKNLMDFAEINEHEQYATTLPKELKPVPIDGYPYSAYAEELGKSQERLTKRAGKENAGRQKVDFVGPRDSGAAEELDARHARPEKDDRSPKRPRKESSFIFSAIHKRIPTFRHFAVPPHGAQSPIAFATFLSNYSAGDDEFFVRLKHDEILAAEEDGYFLSIRVLNYALNHQYATRSLKPDIPFIVLVTEDVSLYKRTRLSRDGMTVIPVNKIALNDDTTPASSRYRDVMTKLRLWTLSDYRKICFIDADHLIVAPIDGVFDDPATDLRRTLSEDDNIAPGEPTPPHSYLFAARDEAGSYDHAIPPDVNADYLNSGFFVFSPSTEMFDYYMMLAEQQGTLSLKNGDETRERFFDGSFPEQNLLNYAHRPEGNMPWQHLNWKWNMGWPTERDVEAGVKSFHAKFWDDDPGNVQELRGRWEEQRWQMEGYMNARDESLSGKRG